MEKLFRWNIFWSTILSFVFLIGLLVLLIDLEIDTKLFVGMLFLVFVGIWIGIFMKRKYEEYLWILGIIMFVLLAILSEFMFSVIDDNRYDEVYFITLLIFVLGYLVLLYWNKLFEIFWGIVMFIFTFLVFFATYAIELIIHPPSEE